MLKKIKTKTGKEIGLRYLCIDDSKDLLELYNSLVDEKAYTIAVKKLTLKEEREFVKGFVREVEEGNAIFLVAEYENKVIGVVSIKRDGPLKEHIGNFGILIANGFRGEGLGRIMIDECIKEAKNFLKIKIVILYAFSENKPAIGLYEKKGFNKTYVLKKGLKHFGRYKDEIFMVKYL
jgi:RimJ/RimL family protein N-acetyltransferase